MKAEFVKQLDRLSGEAHSPVHVDLSEVTFIDFSALNVLIAANSRLRPATSSSSTRFPGGFSSIGRVSARCTERQLWAPLAVNVPAKKSKMVPYADRRTAGLTQVKDVRVRPAVAEDYTFLATMLGEAAVWRPDKPTPTAHQVLADPRYALYLAGWPRQGDYGLVAEQEGPVGSAWYRTFTEASHGYGFVAEDVPELAIAVIASRRHEGIGRRLLVDLIEASVAQGYPAISLSVAGDNPARCLYESNGFVPVEKHGSSWTMIRHAAQAN